MTETDATPTPEKPTHVTDEQGREHRVDEAGWLVNGIEVTLDLSEILDANFEGFLDLISEKAGFSLLQQQEYAIVGHTADTITFLLKGFVDPEAEDEDDAPDDPVSDWLGFRRDRIESRPPE